MGFDPLAGLAQGIEGDLQHIRVRVGKLCGRQVEAVVVGQAVVAIGDHTHVMLKLLGGKERVPDHPGIHAAI